MQDFGDVVYMVDEAVEVQNLHTHTCYDESEGANPTTSYFHMFEHIQTQFTSSIQAIKHDDVITHI